MLNRKLKLSKEIKNEPYQLKYAYLYLLPIEAKAICPTCFVLSSPIDFFGKPTQMSKEAGFSLNDLSFFPKNFWDKI